MDFFAREEMKGFKADKIIAKESIDADKYAFQHKLEGEFGKKMMEELNNPTKPSLWVGIKYRIKRWRTIRKCKREEKRLKKGGF